MSENIEISSEDEGSIVNAAIKKKYQTAAAIANDVLKLVCSEVQPGKTPYQLCELGDNKINELVAPLYNKHDHLPTKVTRGVAFPTCVNVNGVVCHHSPLPEEQIPIQVGDVVRIDLGVHIDGYPAVVAHTIIVQEGDEPINGRIADLMHAAMTMLDVVIRCLRPGKKNNDIPPLLEKVAEAYGVNICEGVLSHQMKRYILDGNQCLLTKTSNDRRVDDVVFGSGQVWTIDILLSTGKGKLAEGNIRCCVFKRNPEQQYMLKLKASQAAFKEINTRFQTFPFSLRALDPKTGRLGIAECLKHELVVPYPVLLEKPGEDVVHFKRTVFIFNRIEVVTGMDITQKFVSEKKCEDPEVVAVLSQKLPGEKKAKAADGGKETEKPESKEAGGSPGKDPEATS